MGVLGKRRNKKYSYQPRYYRNENASSPFEIKGKFDEYRSTLGNNGLKNRFQRVVNDYKMGTEKTIKIRLMIIIAILVLLFLWFINFDFSIFKL